MTDTRPSVAAWLAEARRRGLDRLDAQVLLAHLLGRTRTWLLAHDDTLLQPEQRGHLETWLARRVAGEPLAYLLGEKEFHGLRLEVNADVLVPRPDTEVLVDWAMALLHGALADRAAPSVIDLGTGSGAIALAVKHGFPAAAVLATDTSAAALSVARRNAQSLGLGLDLAEGAWWQAAAGRRFDLALSNPPYIAAADQHLAALAHEPLLALTPGGDGLGALHALVDGAAPHLQPGGWLLLEHGHDQADAVAQRLREAGFADVQTRHDLAGLPRCTGGHL